MDRLNDVIKSEVNRQFIQGYDFFREYAGQEWLKHPEVNVYPISPKDDDPFSIQAHITMREERDHVDLSCPTNNTSRYIDKGSFLHEGAESAYFLARAHKGFEYYSPDVGEFVGNLAIAEITGRIPSHGPLVLEKDGYKIQISEITTSDSLALSVLQTLNSDSIRKLFKNNDMQISTAQSLLLEELIKDGMEPYTSTFIDTFGKRIVEELSKDGLEPYASTLKYAKANDLIQAFMEGTEDRSLIRPFLKNVTEIEEMYGISLDQMFELFKPWYEKHKTLLESTPS